MNFYQRMGILPLKKCVNRDKCSFATKQRMFGVFAIDEILRYRGSQIPGSRTLCHPVSCKSKHLLIQFWAKTSHFCCQPLVRSLPPLIHTWCISPAQSLEHHHIASLCKALFFPQMICSAAAGWPRALREAPWAEPGVTLGLWAKQQLQAQAVKRPTQLRLSDIL